MSDYSTDCDCGCGAVLTESVLRRGDRTLRGHSRNGLERRYAVIGITGYAAGGNGGCKARTSFSVVDRLYLSREVGRFYADEATLRNAKGYMLDSAAQEAHRLAQARALCARLNADERAWELSA